MDNRRLHVLDLDAIDGTPVLDIKPFMDETRPVGDVEQPDWSKELMPNYYEISEDAG